MKKQIQITFYNCSMSRKKKKNKRCEYRYEKCHLKTGKRMNKLTCKALQNNIHNFDVIRNNP